ncbi:hypothetical protein BB559_006522 [Furculomyces boomerangus]|uniref:Aldehyde dehydrogenase domain-containing protein n=1 Tax=Furculomyces boomerangus TaxID=61424 RepID=A0A2T9Y2A3_9FUNG|nr:hypothetical protein BB559_006522 [Furculomyces boomerangus]
MLDCLQVFGIGFIPLGFTALSCFLAYYIYFKTFIFEQVKFPSAKINLSIPSECQPDWKQDKFVNSSSISDNNDKSNIICYDPATGKLLGIEKASSEQQVNEAAYAAKQAQIKWSQTSFAQRRQVLRTLCDYIIENQSQICMVACRESGKTMVDAMLGEVLTTMAKLRWTIDNGEKVLKPSRRSPGTLMMYKQAMVVYQPRGVVGSIVSWNYPFHNSIGPVISAIFAGNGIVVKTSEYAAFSRKYFQDMVRAALEAHGHSGDLVQYVTGFADTGKALVECPLISHITFIGSANVGKKIMESASKLLTPVTLELGGKDCAIVLTDADMSQCNSVLMRGVFQNAGQNCIGIERILMHADLYDNFVKEMTTRISNLRLGSSLEQQNGVDMGAMTMGNNFGFLQSLIDDAVSKGARLVVGGKPFSHPKYPNGQYFEPTLLVDVTTDMKITVNEVFGPIMTVMKINSAADAIRVANSSPFGLGASVFTSDIVLGRQVSMALNCGMVNFNDFAVNYLCQSLPFGGVGISGFGRFAGEEGLRAMTAEKSYTEDLFTAIKTKIPGTVDYPIKDADKALKFTQSITEFAFGSNFQTKAMAAMNLGKLS